MDNSRENAQSVVLAKLKATGARVGKIATEMAVNRSAVYQSINGQGSRRIRIHIAKITGIKPSELWPDMSKNCKIVDDAHYTEGTQNGVAQ